MKVVVPFTSEGMRVSSHSAVMWQANAVGIVPLFHDVSGSDTAYCELLAMLWAEGQDFVIVEHDVVPHHRVFREFTECPEPYCAFAYEVGLWVGPALGCSRFRTELLASVPDAMVRVASRPTNWGPPGHWRQLDVALLGWVLRDEEGLQPHVHLPPVEHLNEAKQLHPVFESDPVVTEYIAGTPAAWMLQARLHGIERVR